ncbi:histidine kinase [Fulvivirga sp. RKSG066]|uniref:sensor histidine kinase n=1 Tax=Fulvivirga aurantia TaxID=2529383 RepID=UPI0012BB5777|nr:histidine kinase [Fulvivirga aurantia]MTI22302.1 histidine kinase [Fulvivirga aurantia]
MEHEVVLGATITMMILAVIIILLFGVFQSKKNKYLLAQKRFEEEIAKSQIEIHEQALKNIAWELHDNIGQLLSVARLQLNVLHAKIDDPHQQQIDEVSALIGDSLKEIRLLSKALNTDVIREIGLKASLELELDRFNKLNFLEARLVITGKPKPIDHQDEIIIFRILQEFFNNVIKHSKASELLVLLTYTPQQLSITATENGIGFNYTEVTKGSGLINMKSRSALIGAEYTITSAVQKGSKLELIYPLRNKNTE